MAKEMSFGLTREQRAAALEKALTLRRARAEVKSRMKAGTLSFTDALAIDCVQGMRTYDLLRSVPGIGTHKAEKLMNKIPIAKNRRVKGLGKHQKVALLDEVEKFVNPQPKSA